MKNKALVVIDIQNDITKNYKEIIENIFSFGCNLFFVFSQSCL